MSQRIACANPGCTAVLEVSDDQIGQTVLCPECGTAVQVPAPSETEDHFGDIKAAAGEGKVLHPARQQCPNCGAVLGVRAAICPQCGADIRTGALTQVAARRRGRDWTPFVIGGAIAAALTVLVVLIVVAANLVKKRQEAAQLAQQQAEQETVVAAPEAVPQEEGPKVVLTEADFGTLGEQEQSIAQAVATYKVRLRDVLGQVRGASSENLAAQWADLYAFCRDNGLPVEADMCWMRAVQLRPRASEVNARLGRTETYAGLPVTPEQRQFLEGLQPTVRVLNQAADLSGHTVRVGGQGAVPFGWEDRPEFRPAAGAVRIEVLPGEGSSGPQHGLSLTAQAGLTYTVIFRDAGAAPEVDFNNLASLYNALTGRGSAANVVVERDWQGQVSSMRAGELSAAGTPDAPLSMQMARQETLSVVGFVGDGDPYSGRGQHAFWGRTDAPLRFTIDSSARTVALSSGTYCTLKIEPAEGLWGVLATAQGDVGTTWARKRLSGRAAQLELATAGLEARGEVAAPWRALDRAYGEMAALHRQIKKDLDYMDRAARRPAAIDCVRALGVDDRVGHLYLNWPRFREALASLTKECSAAVIQQVGPKAHRVVEPSRPQQRRRVRPFEDLAWTEMPADLPVFGAPAAAPPRPASPLAPPPFELSDEARPYALMKVLAVLPDDVALQQAREYWEELDLQGRVAAMVSLEKVATPSVVSFLGELSQEGQEVGVVTAALLSLGAIGTPEALRYCEAPGVLAAVRMASLAARAVAGEPAALEGLQSSLSAANAQARATFLDYVSQSESPAVLLVLSAVADTYSDAEGRAKIAGALARIGGRAAMSELARLMEASGNVFPDLLSGIEQEDALMLVRSVGAALGQGKGGDAAVDFLLTKGGQAGRAFLRAAAVNQGNAAAMLALLQAGTADSIRGAAEAAHAVDLALLQKIRPIWYTAEEGTGEWAWNQPLDTRAAKDFLRAVLQKGRQPRLKLAAAHMLLEVGEKPDAQVLLSLAGPTEERLEAPTRPGRRPPARGAPVDDRPDFSDEERGRFMPPTVGAGAQYSPPGFEEPKGAPRLPTDARLEAKPQLYALGLLVKVADEGVSRRLREMVGSCKDAEVRRAALIALGMIGGEANLEFLRAGATTRAESYAKTEEVVDELRGRLMALSALCETQDTEFLPRLLDVLHEAPPADSAIMDVADYANLSAWWQVRLWQEACDCLTAICRTKQLFELTADGELQRKMTDRLLALIEQPGPSNDALADASRQLKFKAVRAYARCASPYEANTLLVVKRLALSVPAAEDEDSRMARYRDAYAEFQPRVRAPRPGETQRRPESLKDALRDAVVCLALRGGGFNWFSEVPGLLPRQGETNVPWSQMLRGMAGSPPPRYFELVNMVFDSLGDEARQGIFDVTRAKGHKSDPAYALFVAKMIRRPVRDKTAEDEVEAGLQPVAPVEPDYTPEMLAAIEAEEAMGRFRGTELEHLAYLPRPAAAPETKYVRHGPRRKQEWSYSAKEVGDSVGALRRKWAVVDLLFEGSATAVAAAIEEENLFNHRDFGPEIAVKYAGLSTAGRQQILAAMRALLVGSQEVTLVGGAGPGFETPTGRVQVPASTKRSAALVLRRLGGEEAAQTLYDALVGPPIVQTVVTDMMMPMEERGGGPPREVLEEMRRRGRMPVRRTVAFDPGAASVARALGGLGREDLLRNALNAQRRSFFADNPTGVQMAALEGMAFLPDQRQTMALLSELLRLATTAELREAVGNAIVTALERAGFA